LKDVNVFDMVINHPDVTSRPQSYFIAFINKSSMQAFQRWKAIIGQIPILRAFMILGASANSGCECMPKYRLKGIVEKREKGRGFG